MKCLKFSKNKLKKAVEDEKTFQAHGFGTTNFVKLATLPKGICRVNVNPIKISMTFFIYMKSQLKNIENKKNNLDIHIETHNSITAQALACRKNNA